MRTFLPSWLSAAQQDLYAGTVRIAREALAPIAASGEPGRVNRPLVAALYEHGLLPRLFPQSMGGTATDEISSVDLCLLRDALAQGCVEAETALALQGLGSYPMLQSGHTDLARRWVPEVARGGVVAAFALSEPDAGSDAAALSLSAARHGDEYRLTGTKTWISNAPGADLYTVFARTDAGAGARGITAFVVPADAPGVSGRAIDLMASHPIGTLELDGVLVHHSNRVGAEGDGFKVAMRTLDLFRPSVGAFAVGMAEAAVGASVEYAQSRHAFGGPLAELQAISHRLADMATKVAAARYLVYEAARIYDDGGRVTRASAMAKLFATETAQEVVDAAIQIHGARALEKGHLLEHLYRDVRGTRIYEGTSEIQREIIARDLFS